MVCNEITYGEISCLSFLKGTDYALYVGPDLNDAQKEQLKLKNLPFPVLYLPEIFGQLSDAVCQYNFPGVKVPELLTAEGIYGQIIAESGDDITSENRLIIRYQGDAFTIYDAKRSFSQLISYLLNIANSHSERRHSANRPMWKAKSPSGGTKGWMDDLFKSMNEIDIDIDKVDHEFKFDHEMKQALIDVKEVIDHLMIKGCPPEILLSMINQSVKLSRLKITRQFKIILTDYNDLEIKMGPLPKTLFLFFLRHPEGVMYSHLQDHRDEIRMIYEHLCTNDDPQKMEESVARLVDPFDNSINEKCASVKKAFVLNVADSIASNYYIFGQQGKPKKIILDRSLVDWECEF